MPFPVKFRQLMEQSEIESNVTIPDYAWLSYALCCAEKDSCGWTGWIIDAVKKCKVADDGGEEKDYPLYAADNQRCPDCGKMVYRTGVEKRYDLKTVQPQKILYEYDVVPLTFGEGDDHNGLERMPGKTPPTHWPDLPPELCGEKPKWNSKGYWKGRDNK